MTKCEPFIKGERSNERGYRLSWRQSWVTLLFWQFIKLPLLKLSRCPRYPRNINYNSGSPIGCLYLPADQEQHFATGPRSLHILLEKRHLSGRPIKRRDPGICGFRPLKSRRRRQTEQKFGYQSAAAASHDVSFPRSTYSETTLRGREGEISCWLQETTLAAADGSITVITTGGWRSGDLLDARCRSSRCHLSHLCLVQAVSTWLL